MTDLERFLAIVRGEKPDYYPIFGFPGAPGMSNGALRPTHESLVAQGMPSWVGGCYDNWQCRDVESWRRYWGTTGPVCAGIWLGRGAKGFKSSTRIENGFEIIEDECGAMTRQVINNANEYSMPEFVRFPVRDRASWEFWKERATPTDMVPWDEFETYCRTFDNRDKPLDVEVGGIYSFLRGLMGPEGISIAFYEDPELVHDMAAWKLDHMKKYILPGLERLRPEIITLSEDLCYNHGMLLSPKMFDDICGPHYKAACDCAKALGVEVITVDSDGNVMEFVDTVVPYGVNSLHPFEVKAGNDLFALRRKHPRFICFGWLEKEVVNAGNEALIENEILSKVPALLASGYYFPNGDHGIQPPITYKSLCRFMTLLHEVCGNPEGLFPRM